MPVFCPTYNPRIFNQIKIFGVRFSWQICSYVRWTTPAISDDDVVRIRRNSWSKLDANCVVNGNEPLHFLHCLNNEWFLFPFYTEAQKPSRKQIIEGSYRNPVLFGMEQCHLSKQRYYHDVKHHAAGKFRKLSQYWMKWLSFFTYFSNLRRVGKQHITFNQVD